MKTVVKVLLILLFVSILFLENAFFLQKYYIFISIKTQTPSLMLKEKVNAFFRCIKTHNKTLNYERPSDGKPLNLNKGILTVSGEATPGFLLLSDKGEIIGKVIKSEKGIIYVATPFSELFSMNITLEGSPSYEGRLIGGVPPLVEVDRDVNVDGMKVWISESEKYGLYLRSKGEGYLGKIKGKSSKLWILDYKLPKGPYKVVGR